MRADVVEALLSYIYTYALPAAMEEGRSDEDATSSPDIYTYYQYNSGSLIFVRMVQAGQR
jgi:hypothetical protein